MWQSRGFLREIVRWQFGTKYDGSGVRNTKTKQRFVLEMIDTVLAQSAQ
ncbi:MAG: hypothetical protein HYS18_02480 [Burkholderiales bacterium]|nr:hypothetical protein [Burkholderiales bacterium]